MDSFPKLHVLVLALLEQLPSILVLLSCMIFAVIRWSRHPRVSLFVLLSLGLMILHGILYAVVFNWIPDWFIHSADPANTERVARNVYLVLNLVSNGSLAIALTVLLVAIFTQRPLAIKEI
jgi:hypothetical protein